MIRLTSEQLTALRKGHDCAEVHDESGEPYVIIRRDAYVHLRELAGDADAVTQDRLRYLIQEGIDSGDYQPHDQVFEDLRAYAADLDSQQSP
ncbi:MAG: hypothetical protein HYV60_19845 [Planctomycetia bacterium]|nr:hypothetical protein [Planctomycetia bacterium]